MNNVFDKNFYTIKLFLNQIYEIKIFIYNESINQYLKIIILSINFVKDLVYSHYLDSM